jgi:PAS domain S-box-containing protein
MTLEYDNAWAKYQAGMKITPTPIVCWDFFSIPSSDMFLVNSLQKKWSDKFDFLNVTEKENRQIIITNTSFKIVFASNTIVDMNGYNSREVIGKSPGMFQGSETCLETKKNIETALKNLKSFKEVILNYKKNGEIYWCEIEAHPKFDKQGNFVNYIAFERLVA